MIYYFHKTDLEPGAPRVLPSPLRLGIVLLPASAPLVEEVASMLASHGADPTLVGNRWYAEIWDERVDFGIAAFASFRWTGDSADVEAIWMADPYRALDLESYLRDLGQKLGGT